MFSQTFKSLALVAGLTLSSVALAAPANTASPSAQQAKPQGKSHMQNTKGGNERVSGKAKAKLQPRTGASGKRIRSTRNGKGTRTPAAKPVAPATTPAAGK